MPIAGSPPTIVPTLEFAKPMPNKYVVVPLLCVAQVIPPSFDRRMVPPSPLATTEVESMNWAADKLEDDCPYANLVAVLKSSREHILCITIKTFL